MNNILYQQHILAIGGVETFLYELAKLTYEHQRDLTIVYRTGDNAQIERLRKFCRVVALKDIEKPIRCHRAIFNYGIDAINQFEADEYIQIIHADFKSPFLKNFTPIRSDKITRYLAVSQNNAKSFEELTGVKADVFYNPISIEQEPRIMTLVSAQRLSPEKGGRRIESMIKALDSNGIPYVWHIFSGEQLSIESENVVYHKPTLDIRKWIKYADYVVQLSDTEGFPYTLYESLCIGTPIITTRLPILGELGATDENSIILDFDMSNLDVYQVYKRSGKFKFQYKQKPDRWLDLLTDASNFVPPVYVKLRAERNYYDTSLERRISCGEVYTTSEDRANEIVNLGFAERI